MLNKLDLNHLLFLDIETVPEVYNFDDLDEKTQELWGYKMKWQMEKEALEAKDLYEKAGIYAEFGKIICISVGFLVNAETPAVKYRTTSFAGDDEKKLLKEFADLLNTHYNRIDRYLCAHNGKEFDFPYIARRMLINGVRLPKMLDIAGLKPWEIKHIDTMELWKFGDYKHYTSLNLLAHLFGIPTPKDDINGADVARVYYEEGDIDRIVTYCEKDTLTVCQLLLKYKGLKMIEQDQIIRI
jgi:uncharacterized protein YprB with RNaseH-like and TPR domain